MSLRDEIVTTITQARDVNLTDLATAARIMGLINRDRAAHEKPVASSTITVNVAKTDGIDQGVSRLELAAFLSGWHGPWNGGGDNPWVRYRGHQITRQITADGYVADLTYRDHENVVRSAGWSSGQAGRYALGVVGMIDELLDVVIEHHGIEGAS